MCKKLLLCDSDDLGSRQFVGRGEGKCPYVFWRGNGKANLTREGTCIVAQQPRGRRSRHPTRGEGGVRIGGRVRDTIDAGTC